MYKESFTRNVATLSLALLVLAATTTQSSAAEKEVVEYRLLNWKSLHFDDAAKAEKHFETVKKSLGCEAKKENHGGHIDVSYRCPQWRKIELSSHKSAHEWESWLKASGFETKHTH